MKLLLDTCAFLWFLEGDSSMPPATQNHLLDMANEVWVSHVSFLEIQIKYTLGKLDLKEPPDKLLPAGTSQNGFREMALDEVSIFEWGRLPLLHRDPFDRLLIAQARVHGMELVSNDQNLLRYSVPVFWKS